MVNLRQTGRSIFLIIIISLVLKAYSQNDSTQNQQKFKCDCLNGGVCTLIEKQIFCDCPPGFIGTKCETVATQISQIDQQVTLHQNYSYFYFQPSQINYYQMSLKICLPQNESINLTNFVFLQVERSSGKLKLEPSIYQTSPLIFQEGENRCQTFYTHFIPIRKKSNDDYQKIIFGVAIKNNSDNVANRWVNFLKKNMINNDGSSLRTNDVSNDDEDQEIMSNQPQIENQKIIISCSYQLYLVQNYWGTIIIVMSAITLFVSTGVFLYTIRNKYSYNLTNQDILRLYAVNPQEFMNHQNIKNDLQHFRLTMPIMSYELLVQKAKNLHNKQSLETKKRKIKVIKKVVSKQSQNDSTCQQLSPDELISSGQQSKNDEQNGSLTNQDGMDGGQLIESTCTICLINFENDEQVRQTPCGHIFHADCIDSWCENTLNCPVCRQSLDFPRKIIKKQRQNEIVG